MAALEILVVNAAIASNIREGKTHQIASLMQMGAKTGSRLLNDALLELVKSGQVDAEQAYLKSIQKDDFVKKCQQEGIRVAARPEDDALPRGPLPGAGGDPHAAAGAKPSGAFEEFRRQRG